MKRHELLYGRALGPDNPERRLAWYRDRKRLLEAMKPDTQVMFALARTIERITLLEKICEQAL